MTAIAGYLRHGAAAPPPAEMCRRLLAAQAVYGPDDSHMVERGAGAFGRALHRLLPEDEFDRQPIELGPLTLVADLRIDNRDEIAAALGGTTGDIARISDAELLLRAWERWGEGALDRLLGDFAFAVADSRDGSVVLVRDSSGQRPLHYVSGAGFTAFATMPAALARLPGVDGGADEERLARFVADVPSRGPRSFFCGVARVEPGGIVRLAGGRTQARRWWNPEPKPLRLPCEAAYAEAMRDEIDKAVRVRLRRARGAAAAHLSAGFDSSAVATAAAVCLVRESERLLAFTSAPRAGFTGLALAGRIGDESGLAAATAALHANVDHRVLRPAAADPLALAERTAALAQQPAGHVCNNVWWSAVEDAARERGATVLLTGEMGNHTISAGSVVQLADLVRRGRMATWLREARALAVAGRGWRGLLGASFGPFVPEAAYRALRRLAGGAEEADSGEFLAPRWREEMARRRRLSGWDSRPAPDSRRLRLDLLSLADPGTFRKASLAARGIDERDPTADRRLVEFCLSLPPAALLRNGVFRPVLRRALAGRVPDAVLDHPLRGYQMPDWYEHIRADGVAAALDRIDLDRAGAVVDAAAMRTAAAAWPESGFETRPLIVRYRMKLMRAVTAAGFLAANRPCGGS